jgi:hypothetical protein
MLQPSQQTFLYLFNRSLNLLFILINYSKLAGAKATYYYFGGQASYLRWRSGKIFRIPRNSSGKSNKPIVLVVAGRTSLTR